MKKDKPYLDESVKRQFELERVEPPAFIWDNVKQTIADDSKKKVFPFWIIAALCLGLVADTFIPQRNEALAADLTSVTEASIAQNTTGTATTRTNRTVQGSISDTDENSSDPAVAKLDQMNVKETTSTIQQKNSRTPTKSQYSFGRNSDLHTGLQSSHFSEQQAVSSIPNANETPAISEVNSSEGDITKTDESEVPPGAKKDLMEEIAALDLKDLALLDTKDAVINTEKCYSFGKKRTKSFCGLEAYGAGFANPLLLSSKNVETEYLNNRKATEKAKGTIGAGLALRYYLSPHWYLKVGGQYQEITTQFNYINADEVRVDSAGKIINGTRIKQTTNRLQIFEIPLMVGYQKNYGSFSFNVSSGLGIGLWQKRKGDILDTNQKPISIGSGTIHGDSLYRSSTTLSLLFSAGLEYKLTPSHQLFIRPTFQYYLNDFSSAANPIAEKYVHFGLQAGLFIRL